MGDSMDRGSSKSRSSNSSRSSSNGTNSSRCSSIGSNWGSSSNWDMGDSMDRGSMSSYNSLGGVSLICCVVDVRGLNNLLDRVNLVWSGDWDSTRNGNLIRLSDVLVDNDFTGNSTWDSNRNINIVFLDIDLWDNVGNLGSDSGVGSDRGSNLGLDNGVSRSGTSWDRCRRNGSERCWGSRDDWRSNRNGFN